MHLSAIILLLVCSYSFYSVIADTDCQSNQNDPQDSYLISAILENALSKDCLTLRKLAGIFFETQERPPHSVRITYSLCIPYNSQCDNCQYNCWSNEVCSRTVDNSTCPEGHCYIKKEFLWGRVPLIVQDNIYRTLNICPFMIGGNTEKYININFTLTPSSSDEESGDGYINCITTKQFPCNWCRGDTNNHYRWKYYSDINLFDDIATIRQYYSTLDIALITLTEKLQGYAVKAQALPWLKYSSDLAIGYASPYPILSHSSQTFIRYIGFFISYVLFQLILFMLIYKYRRRLYRRVYTYINTDPINSAFFYAFIATTILTSIGMLVATNSGGYCLSLLQMIFLGIALLFSIPHGLITCFRLKKTSHFFTTYPIGCCCLRFKWPNVLLQVFVFWLIYSMPHVIMYLVLTFTLNFLYSPFSYLIVLLFLALSILALWVGNAIAIHLMSPSIKTVCDVFKNKVVRRRLIFAICIVTAVNILYLTAWGFVATSFYDKRGHANSYLTFIPGFAITVIGWYLSGDMVKLFDMFTQSNNAQKAETSRKYSKQSFKDSDLEVLEEDDSEGSEGDTEESIEALHIIQQKGDRARYSVKRLKRIMRAVQRPSSFTMSESSNEGSSLV